MTSGNFYPEIDLCETGKHLEKLVKRRGYSVKDIQNILHLSCPQPVYRWFRGKVLPTVDHLYVLAQVLNVHMEELLVPRYRVMEKAASLAEVLCYKRLLAYRELYSREQ